MGNITSDKNGGALDSANLSRKKVAGMEVGLQVVLTPADWPMEKSSKRLYKGVTELNRDGQKGGKKPTAPPKSWASLFKKVEEEGKASPEKSDITSDFSVSMLTEVDSSVQLENFCHATRIDLIHLKDNEMMFSMMGIDESIALEFRRILIEEIPTMAFDHVNIEESSADLNQYALLKQLALVPIRVDPKFFEFAEHKKGNENIWNEKNSIVFRLDLVGHQVPYTIVKSDDLKWSPNGSELPWKPKYSQYRSAWSPDENENSLQDAVPRTYTSYNCSQDSLSEFVNNPISVRQDIRLFKLWPGERVKLEAYAVKGFGKRNVKWSPVATAYYKPAKKVKIRGIIPEPYATKFKTECPTNVFDIEDIEGIRQLTVARSAKCINCGRCCSVDFVTVAHTFYFTIQSTGSFSPMAIFKEGVKVWNETLAYDELLRKWKNKTPKTWV